MKRYIPSQADCDIIKRAAARESRLALGAVLLEPGSRYNTKDETRPGGINIALVSDDPHWGDTDLADYEPWGDFRKGIELTADGRGIVDFYIRRRFDEYGELHGNVTAIIEAGKLVRVHGYGDNAAEWRAA